MVALVGMVAGLVLSALPARAAGALPFQPQVVKLDNGLRLVMVPYDSPGLIAYYSLVRVGSRDEVEKGVTGFAHFFEHMMFRGTDRYPQPKVQELLMKAGADQNGFTTDDFTCYTFVGSSAFLEELVDYEADRFQNLKYSELDFKTEAGAVLGEYNKSTSGTYLPLQERLRSQVFTRHTYGHTTLGYLADIKDMPNQYAYSREFFRRFYTPDNTTLIVVGDFEPAKLTALVKQHYGSWKLKRDQTKTQAEPPQAKEVRARVDFPNPTLPRLSVSWRTPATKYGSPETAAYNVLFELLFGNTSKLYTELVLEEQVVASFDNWSWDHRDPYQFQAVATVKAPARLEAVEKRIDAAVEALAKQGPDAKTLADVKSHVRYGLLLSLSTPSEVANRLAYAMGPTGEVNGLEKLLGSIDALTPKDVQRFAQQHLTRKNRAVVTLISREANQ